jgi:hypothetical protein
MKGPKLWNKLEESIDQMIDYGYEEHLFKSLKTLVEQKKLDYALEYAYKHVKDVMNNEDILSSLKEKRKVVTNTAKSFLDTVEKMKNC